MSIILPPVFCRRMHTLLGDDYAAFIRSYDRPLRRGLRVNTLKYTSRALSAHLSLSPTPFAADSFYLEKPLRAGADPLHHAGAYYMQEPSAMAAVTVLAPQPGERVLDLCAAPGGKSTQIAAALGGTGLLWCNEYVRSRAQVLLQNLERCGVRNAVTSSCDAAVLCAGLAGIFDAVLVDAPCSGEGMFRKEPEALAQWSEENIARCAMRQRDILDAAAQAVRPGGRLVYSTCTFAPEENECVAAWFLLNHPEFTLVDSGVSFGSPGLDGAVAAPFAPDLPLENLPLSRCRRIFPHQGGEGHFIALFRRNDSPSSGSRPYIYAEKDTYRNTAEKLYTECFSSPAFGIFQTFGTQIRLLPESLPDMAGLGVLNAGVAAAVICKNRLEPCHALFMASRPADCVRCLDLSADDPRIGAYLRGEEVEAPGLAGWTAVAVDGVVTGFGKAGGGVLKNRYPKGLRLRG